MTTLADAQTEIGLALATWKTKTATCEADTVYLNDIFSVKTNDDKLYKSDVAYLTSDITNDEAITIMDLIPKYFNSYSSLCPACHAIYNEFKPWNDAYGA